MQFSLIQCFLIQCFSIQSFSRWGLILGAIVLSHSSLPKPSQAAELDAYLAALEAADAENLTAQPKADRAPRIFAEQ
jgi:hypothetical protein